MKIKVYEDVLKANQRLAELNRAALRSKGVFTLNVIGSPGSGKTTLLEASIPLLREGGISVGVIEGDIATSRDAERIGRLEVPVVQINTQGACHLDAAMIQGPLDEMPLDEIDILFVENVGNLVCPAGYDLGENGKVVVLSLPEGLDKPAKYPVIFRIAAATVVSKLDLLAGSDFSVEELEGELNRIRGDQPVFPLSARTGDGLEAWINWLADAAHRPASR